jgi:hypothetical protein
VAPAVLAYVDAVNAEDLDALVSAFASEAVITDVSRQISGGDAIRDWRPRRWSADPYRVLDVVEDRDDGQLLLVHWAPGRVRGWRAHYNFIVADGRLTAARPPVRLTGTPEGPNHAQPRYTKPGHSPVPTDRQAAQSFTRRPVALRVCAGHRPAGRSLTGTGAETAS